MNNCLVTKLKGTVNNDSLSRLGVIEVVNLHKESPTAGDTYHLIKAPDSTLNQIKSVTNGVEGPSVFGVWQGSSEGNQYIADSYRLYNKYDYTYLQFGTGFVLKNAEELIGCDKIETLRISTIIPDYVLAKMRSLKDMNATDARTSGTVENWAKVAREYGRDSGFIKFTWGTDMTIGGKGVAFPVGSCVTHFDLDFEWVSDSSNEVETPPKIVWTNTRTSAERIAEWQAQGATVTVYDNGSVVQTYNPTNV